MNDSVNMALITLKDKGIILIESINLRHKETKQCKLGKRCTKGKLL